jgi:tetratricopeptide (TPR) repeat protein
MKVEYDQTLEANLISDYQALIQQVLQFNELMTALEAEAKYSEAAIQAKAAWSALETAKQQFPPFTIPTALEIQVLNNLGRMARILGEYETAQQYYLKAIDLARSAGITYYCILLSLLNGLAIVCKYWGKFEEGEQLYQIVLRTLLQQYGEQNAFVATIYHNLAGLEYARSRCDRAEPYARKSYELHLQLFGKEHPDAIADGAALGSILHGLGKWDEAIPLFETAITFFEQPTRFNPYEVAVNLNNLAASLQAKQALPQAEQAYRRALSIKQDLFGKDHVDVALTLNNLALLLKQQGEIQTARSMLEDALSIFDKTLGSEHPKTLLCLKNLKSIHTTN